LSIRKPDPRKIHASHFDGGNDDLLNRRRFATLRRQATVKVDQNTLETAFKIIDTCEGIGTEIALQKLLGNDYETAAPLLHQLFFYDRVGRQQQ